MHLWTEINQWLQPVSVLIGIVGGLIGASSGIYAFKKIKMDVKEGKYREQERRKAEIVIERRMGNNYPVIHIRNSGTVAAKNMKVQIIHPETGQIIEDHFFPGFPSILNVNQEETSAWTYLEGTAARGVYAMIVVT